MEEYDYIIVGSGFGGAVSALRLAEKGYKVLVLEKGKWWKPEDFPKSNWNLRKWLWLPSLRFFGIMKMTFYRHIGVLSGTGVGGGSLVYANTLPRPKQSFFSSGSWAGLEDWERELAPHYEEAERMLGAALNPMLFEADEELRALASERGAEEHFRPTRVSVYFAEGEEEHADPYFGGRGPSRRACTFCGGCMTGCRHNAKNSLDKNYLYLARRLGVDIIAGREVYDVVPRGADGEHGYVVKAKDSLRRFKKRYPYRTKAVIFSGGVLGTMNLLLKLRSGSLPNLSPALGKDIRTNNEALIFSVSPDKEKELSRGVAIGSIFDVDEKTHLEVVRYAEGSGFWRLGMLPNVAGGSLLKRLWLLSIKVLRAPGTYFRIWTVKDFARQSAVLLFMQQINTTLRFKRGLFRLKTKVDSGKKPVAQIPLAYQLAEDYSRRLGGKPMVFFSETLLNIPSTAHILGGAVIGSGPEEGVVDSSQRVFAYKNMWICDGSVVSSNPGVNPSLTISAMTERAMSLIPPKSKNTALSER